MFGKLRKVWTAYLALGGTVLTMLVGAGAIIEMIYHLQLDIAMGPTLRFMGATLDVHSFDSWFGACFVLATGAALFEVARRHYVRQWDETQVEIEREIKKREASA
jgi:branched-chain amino acid transport system permease protein